MADDFFPSENKSSGLTDIDVDPSDTVYAVFEVQDGDTLTQDFFLRQREASSWGDLTNVTNANFTSVNCGDFDVTTFREQYSNPRVEVDSNGTVHVVAEYFAESVVDPCNTAVQTITNGICHISVPAGASPSAPFDLSSSTDNNIAYDEPRLTLDAVDHPHVVWVKAATMGLR